MWGFSYIYMRYQYNILGQEEIITAGSLAIVPVIEDKVDLEGLRRFHGNANRRL